MYICFLKASPRKFQLVLQRTTKNRSQARAARAARLIFFLARPIKFLICGVVVAVVNEAHC